MNTSIDWLPLLTQLALKGTLLLTLALAAGLILRRLSAARRYLLWLAAALAGVVLPVGVFLLPAWQVLPPLPPAAGLMLRLEEAGPATPGLEKAAPVTPGKAAAPLPAGPPVSPLAAAAPASSAQPSQSAAFTWSWQTGRDLLPALWLAGAGFMLLRLGLSAWRLARLTRTLKALPEPLAAGTLATLNAALDEAGLRARPRLLSGPPDSVPMVWGILRPHLLLPKGFEKWPEAKLRAVLLHELAHLKRRDPLALWIAQIMQALHWFNPLARFTLRRLRADQERACDDAVLRQGIRASDYAQHLLDLSRHHRLAPGLGLCALAMARPAPVEGRVTAILDPRRPRHPAPRHVSLLLVGLGLAAALPLAMLQALEAVKLRGSIRDRHGVVLAETRQGVRQYPLKTLAAHVVGYIGYAAERVPEGPVQGRFGIERTLDADLNRGQEVKLTLDLRMQQAALRVLKEAGITRGNVVILDPHSGEVLVMLSVPSYDGNDFIPTLSQEDWDGYLSDRDLPLLNRTLFPSPPGATAMLPTALAGCLTGVQDRFYECKGSITYGNRRLACWVNTRPAADPHGLQDLPQALANSCACYFYQYGNDTGIEAMIRMNRLLGLGQKTGIELETDLAGTIPSPERRGSGMPWTKGDTASAAVGQGASSASPLQMAGVAAAVASGKVFAPRLVRQIQAPGEKATPNAPVAGADLEAAVTPARLALIRQALRKTVETRSPKNAGDPTLAGITGSVQEWLRTAGDTRKSELTGWFIGYAPHDRPRLAFAIMAEDVKPGGSACIPLARRIMTECLALPADGSSAAVRDHQLRNDVESPPQPTTRTAEQQAWLEKARELQQQAGYLPGGHLDPDRFKARPMRKSINVDWTPKVSPEG